MKLNLPSWEAQSPGKVAINRMDKGDVKRLVDFLTKSGLDIPRILRLRLEAGAAREPVIKAGESRNAYRRRLRRWRKEQHGSISKMRRAKKAQQVKEQRWSLLREQGFPLKDPEALIWFIKTNMWKPGSKLVNFGYLHHSVLLEVAGGTLPTGVDFDEAYYALSRVGKAKHHGRAQRKPVVATITPKDKYRTKAETAIRLAYGKAGFRLKNKRDSHVRRINDQTKGEVGVRMTIEDTAKQRHNGRNRHETNVTIHVNFDWYRTVYLAGLANAAGERSLVLEVRGQHALVAAQPSPSRYALVVRWRKFGKNADGTYWFEEE
jgi:hypothetical protein